MDKNIIIDGVNVAGCKHYKNNGKCRIPHYQQSIKYVSCNCNEWDCDYKQLKRLEQERDKLKEELGIKEIQLANAEFDLHFEEMKTRELEQENEELGRKAFLAEQNVQTTAATFCEKDNKIKELEQENKELKKRLDSYAISATVPTVMYNECERERCRYGRTLEEIREIVTSAFAKQRPYKDNFAEIEIKINEVLQ